MLDLSTAVLCDFAQVRDRLLFTSSGAVSRLYRQELPSPLGLMVGLVIEVPLEDAGMEHTLRAEVINRHGTVLAELQNLFRVSDEGLFPHEVQQVPLVLSITGVRARTWGTHQVRLYLDDELVRALTLYVVPAAGTPAVRPIPPVQGQADGPAEVPSFAPPAAAPAEVAASDDDAPNIAAPLAAPAPVVPAGAVTPEPAGSTGDRGLFLDFDIAEDIEFDLDDDGYDDAVDLGLDDEAAGGAAVDGDDAADADAGTPDAGTPEADTTPGATDAEPAPDADAASETSSEVTDEATDEAVEDTPADDAPAEDAPPPPPPGDAPPAEGQSRFAFRYRYEDDE